MSPQRFIIVKWRLILMLVASIGIISCKKSSNSPQQPAELLKNFIPIPGNSSFIMGSPMGEAGRSSDEIQHEVALSSFYISKYELSRGAFKPFLQSKDMNYLASDQRKIENYTIDGWNETDAHPIVNVSWNTAVRYCNWATKEILKSNDTAYIFNPDGSFYSWNISSKGIRLPTETEWECACRANTTTPFATGDNIIIAAQANYNGHYPYNQPYNPNGKYMQKTVPVDTTTYFRNAFDLEHMHGNVWEWCYDWYDAYPTTKQTNPTGSATGLTRVIRGGSWNDNAVSLRSALRGYGSPGNRNYGIGFRLARTM